MSSQLIHPDQFYSELPKKHLSACLLIPADDGRYLMVKKSATGRWGLPGGIVMELESPQQAALRECLEEINLSCEIDKLIHVYYSMPFLSNGSKRGDSIHFVFLSQTLHPDQLGSINFNDSEISEYKLVNLTELALAIGENLGQAIVKGMQEIAYSNLQRTLAVFQQEESNFLPNGEEKA